jgi:hypothetical protein
VSHDSQIPLGSHVLTHSGGGIGVNGVGGIGGVNGVNIANAGMSASHMSHGSASLPPSLARPISLDAAKGTHVTCSIITCSFL